jgi:hypothetical protein
MCLKIGRARFSRFLVIAFFFVLRKQRLFLILKQNKCFNLLGNGFLFFVISFTDFIFHDEFFIIQKIIGSVRIITLLIQDDCLKSFKFLHLLVILIFYK